MKDAKSVRIALGGVFSGLCVLMMFLSSVLPFTMYAMPMFAGAMLAAVVIENGAKTAMLVYVSTSLLSVFVVPDLEAKLMFITFFGYYAILKAQVEKRIRRSYGMLLKQLIFNAAMIACYFATLYISGAAEAAADSTFLGRYAPAFMLAAGNVLFIMYDYMLTKYIMIYIHWFKPKFFKR